MAVKSSKTAGSKTAGASAATSAPKATVNTAVGAGFGFKGSLTRSPTNLGAQHFEALVSSFRKLFSEADGMNFKIVPVSTARYSVAFSSVLVCAFATEGKVTKVSAYPIVVESTGKYTAVKVSEINTQSILMGQPGRKPELLRLPTDAFDDRLADQYRVAIEAHFGTDVEVSLIDGCVLPTGFNFEQEENMTVLADLAAQATSIRLTRDTEGGELSLVSQLQSIAPSERLEYSINIDHTTLSDEMQRPIRTDWNVQLNLRNYSNDVKSINDEGGDRVLTKTSGYVDVIPTSVDMPVQNGAWQQQAVRFIPHNIITHTFGVYTPGWVLLNLAASTLVRDGFALKCLKPRKDDPMHDIGGLNTIAEIGGKPERMNFFAKGMTDFDVEQGMRRLFQPGTVTSLDIDLYGPQTWAFSIFAAAGAGGARGEQARRLIVAAADDLTNGKFSTIFPEGGAIFSSARVFPRGTWKDKSGVTRDLREIDTTAVINALGDDRQAVDQFIHAISTTGLGNTVTEARILETYKRITDSAVITGRSLLLTCTSAFIESLVQAITSCGFAPYTDGPVETIGAVGYENAAQFMQGAIVQPGAASVGQYRGGPVGVNSSAYMPGTWYS